MSNAPSMESAYRRFLLVTAALIFLLTPLELMFTEHTQSFVQWTPFIFSGIGLAGALAALAARTRYVLRGAQCVMLVVALSSLFGFYEHLEHNIDFEREIRPAAGFLEVWWEALFGASPLLAPGILALGAGLALAAMHRHPVLVPEQGSVQDLV